MPASDGNDSRRNKLHASVRRKKVHFKVGSTSLVSKEMSTLIQRDFFAEEYLEYEKEVLEQEEFSASANEEEGREEERGEEAAGNVEVTSTLRIRRGEGGRFESYAEGSSSSGIEPKRKNRAREKDTSWLLTGPVPGGPLLHDVIPSFGGHIAYNLWSHPEGERKILNKYTRDRSLVELRKWKMGKDGQRIVDDSGLSHLTDLMHKNLNMPLLCTFIERWQPDTNTFHMPWGEMTILLHDVKEILGIPIDGLPCNIPSSDLAHPIIAMSELLGMTEFELVGGFSDDKDQKILRGNSILCRALKELVECDRLGYTSEAQGFLMIL